MPSDDPAVLTRHARRWADAAWVRGWYAHAIAVLDRAVELHPTCYKLRRKRGAFLLLCPDATVRDEEEGIADLRRVCALAGWREEVAGWVVGVLDRNGYAAQAAAVEQEWRARGRRPA